MELKNFGVWFQNTKKIIVEFSPESIGTLSKEDGLDIRKSLEFTQIDFVVLKKHNYEEVKQKLLESFGGNFFSKKDDKKPGISNINTS